MSTTSTRIRTSRFVDTIGVLAVVAGLVLGLVPGLSPAARADITPDCQTHPNFSLDRVILELEEVDGDRTFTLDSNDDYLECFSESNQLGLKFVDDVDDASPLNAFEGLRLYTQQNLADSPLFHVSCSVVYTGTRLSIGPWGAAGSTVFTITKATLHSITGTDADGNPIYKVSGDCVEPAATAAVEKVDAEGNGLAGAEFTLYKQGTTDKAATENANPCTTDANGDCDFGEVAAGDYTMTETAAPAGYTLATPASQDFTLLPGDVAVRTFTDPRIEYEIDVTPDGRNAVGNTHDFIVTLEADGTPLAGATVALAWSGVGSIQSPGSSCTTNGSGQCTVTVDSDDPGSGVLTATFDTPYQNDNGQTAGPDLDDEVSVGTSGTAYDKIADAASKTWVGYEVTISPDDTNLLGDPHSFTVTVYEVDGSGSPDRVIAPGVDVVVSWSGTPAASTLDTTTCTTDAAGECVFTVDSDTNAGAGTLEVESVEGEVAGLDSGSETLTVAFADDEIEAQKTWREYRAVIDDDSVNPVSSAHTFDVQVQYRETAADTWTDAGSGLVVTWDSTGVGVVVEDDDDVDGVTGSTCDEGTDSNGECTIVVHSDTTGDRSVTVLSVKGDLLPGDDDVPGSDDLEYTFRDVAYTSQPDNADETATKTWLGFGASIEATGHNQVGEPHTFTIEVFRTGGPDVEPDVPDGTLVDVEITWDQPHADNEVVSNTCETAGTTDDLCTVTLNNGVAGTATVKVVGLDDFSIGGVVQDLTFATQPTASKTWYAYRASIEADGVNLVGDDHPFTVTAEVNDGTGWDLVPADTTITVSSSGVGSIDALSCETTGATGACVVTVDSSLPGDRVVSVSTVEATETDDPNDTADVSAGTYLQQDQSASATKTWIAYRASVVESATNLTGQEHVFTVTAEQDDGAGWTTVPDGTTVGFSTDNDGTVQSDTCDSTSGGQCTITVDSSSVASVTVTVDSVSAEDVDGDPSATVANGALAAAPAGALDATKDWIAVLVDVEADAINLVGEQHEFTVDVAIVTPDGTIAAPDGTTVVVTEDGVGVIESQTCDSPGTSGGSCTVTVNSSAAGDSTITVGSVTFTHDSTPFTVDFTDDSNEGEASGQDRTATKTWRDHRVDIEADGLNLVRDEHTFTVTIEQTDDGQSWGAVPDGTTATVGIAGSAGSITGGTCESTGTVDGDCTVVVDSATAGTGTVTVSAISVDLPEEERTDIAVDVADDSAAKTWVAFRGLISDDSLNVTGDSHDFTLTGQYTTDGSTWVDVPDGSSIGFSASGVGSTSGDTCGSTDDGDCTVTVTSNDSGQRDVTVESIQATLTINDITESFDVTLEDQASGVLDGADLPVAATKTWASYALELTPAEAVNLLDGTDDDPERFHTITAILTSDDATNAPVGGQTIDVTISGDTGIITDVESGTVATDGLSAECVTAPDGTCDIEIFSAVTGDATLSASYTTAVGDSDPVTFPANDADKTWTTFRVTVTPTQATNLVGNPHTFTVLVEQSNSDGSWVPVIGAVPSISLDADTATITGNTCVDGTVAAGTCLVTVDSDNVEAVTLTAEYEASVGETTAAFSDRGDKTWIDFGIDVTPNTDENLIGTDHVFTVTVTTTFPVADGTSTVPVVGGSVAVQLDGLGAITDNGCAEGTDTNGQCTVTVTSAAAGGSSLTAVYMGTAADDAEVRPYDDTAFKDWVDYELAISPDAVNAVGDAHTFTATLTVDTGDGFGPAAGETLQFTFDGVGSVIGGDVDGDFSCITDGAGACDIVINSEVGGTSTVGVSYGAVAGATSETLTQEAVKQWVDISLVKTAVVGDGLGDGDLVEDPDTGLPTLFFTSSDRGPKIAVFEYLITNTGGDTLFDFTLSDDRLGAIALPEGLTLEPGESTTVRASEQFTFGDAAGGLDNIIVNVGVVSASGDDGSEVFDTDDATIQLIAQRSSILIDLQKDVVVGAGDVEAPDGPPTVTWSQAELEAGATKVVRYAFTITNIGPSPIVDVELTDPMISSQPILAAADGVTLRPGESTVVEVDHVLTVDEAFPDGPTAGEVPNVAAVSGANVTRDAFDQDSDDAIVFVQVVFAEVLERPLPATGFGSGGLLPLAVLLVAVGAGILWLERRRVTGR